MHKSKFGWRVQNWIYGINGYFNTLTLSIYKMIYVPMYSSEFDIGSAQCPILSTLITIKNVCFLIYKCILFLGNGGDWNLVKSLLQEVTPRHPPLEESLVTNWQLLSLYALTIKKFSQIDDIRDEALILNNLLQWISAVKLK